MGFLDNLLREGTKGVLGHASGRRLNEAEARRRGIQDDELEQQTAMNLLNMQLSEENLAEARSRGPRRRAEREAKEAEALAASESAAERQTRQRAALTQMGIPEETIEALVLGDGDQADLLIRQGQDSEAGPSDVDMRREIGAIAQGAARVGADNPDFLTEKFRTISAMQERFPDMPPAIVQQIVEDEFEQAIRAARAEEEAPSLTGEDELRPVQTIDEDRPPGFETSADFIRDGELPPPGSTTPLESVEPPTLSAEAEAIIEAVGSPEAAIQAITSDPDFANDEQAKAVVRELTLAIGG